MLQAPGRSSFHRCKKVTESVFYTAQFHLTSELSSRALRARLAKASHFCSRLSRTAAAPPPVTPRLSVSRGAVSWIRENDEIGGKEGEELHLEVLGYQFPGTKDDEWGSEWLIIVGQVSCARGRWKFRDPWLCTFELQALATWLRDVRVGGPERELYFTEPNLRFEHVETSDGDVLLTAFSQESSPPWATEGERYGEGSVLPFPFCLNDFAAVSAAMEGMLLKWPIRTRRSEAS